MGYPKAQPAPDLTTLPLELTDYLSNILNDLKAGFKKWGSLKSDERREIVDALYRAGIQQVVIADLVGTSKQNICQLLKRIKDVYARIYTPKRAETILGNYVRAYEIASQRTLLTGDVRSYWFINDMFIGRMMDLGLIARKPIEIEVKDKNKLFELGKSDPEFKNERYAFANSLKSRMEHLKIGNSSKAAE